MIILLLAPSMSLTGVLGLTAAPTWAMGVLFKTELNAKASNYCHLKFPAIRPDTLYRDEPVLQDQSTGDVIDFYGACDHNPLGQDEIARQRHYQKYDLMRSE